MKSSYILKHIYLFECRNFELTLERVICRFYSLEYFIEKNANLVLRRFWKANWIHLSKLILDGSSEVSINAVSVSRKQ